MKGIVHFFLISAFSILISCEEKPYFQEIISEKYVSISILEHEGESMFMLNVPIEFSLNLNQKDVKDVRIYYTVNNKRAMRVQDFLVYNGDTNEKLYAIEDLEYGKYPKSIYIIDRRLPLTKEKATEMLNKYTDNQSLNDLKAKNDTISLVSYRKFREDYPKFLEKMREEPDSLALSIAFSGGRAEVFGEKINW
ncbi:MAG: hypothetical protein ACK5MD_10530 [Flavobacteriales bacterium]